MKKKEKQKQKRIILLAIILIIFVIGIILIFTKKQDKPEDTLKQYFANLQQKNYEVMYDMLSKNSKNKYSKEDFITRNQNIYEGINVSNIIIEEKEINKQKEQVTINYHITMDTVGGKLEFDNQMNIVKEEKQNKIVWSSKDIFPKLTKSDTVKVKTSQGKRGNIYDRNGKMLAGEGTASSIGIVPGKMNEQTKTQDIKQIANLLETTEEKIKQTLNANWVKQDTFVPIQTIEKTKQELKNKLLEIKGVKITDIKERIYPYGEITSHLLGYTQNISLEELQQLSDKGYSTNSIIGKTGLEKDYEEMLRPKNSSEILIVDEEGNTKQTLTKTGLENGQDITITIDITLQEKLYNEFKQDKSCSVMMNYKTGEILALVSTPTFNSNDFSMGITTTKWNNLNNNEKKPLYNRYKQTWTPGSSFKPIIGAIAITTNSLDPKENFGKSGTKWQKDSSWGNFYITTLKEYGNQVDLKNALINSDNIYFAKVALKVGTSKMEEQLTKIGFGENLELGQYVANSTYGQNGKISSEGQLANTGYGQGQVLVNPIHMASIYSAFLNEGNMIKPYLIKQENKQTEYLKQEVFSKQAANTIKEDLIQVVEDEAGTAHSAKISGKTIGGKTGTAEIKTSKEDENGTEIGWFNAFNYDEQNPLLVISMVEDVKNRGGSHYLLPKIKEVLK